MIHSARLLNGDGHHRGDHYGNRLIARFAAAVVVVLAGCNTMEGAGRDIERGGEKIQDAAGKAKK